MPIEVASADTKALWALGILPVLTRYERLKRFVFEKAMAILMKPAVIQPTKALHIQSEPKSDQKSVCIASYPALR